MLIITNFLFILNTDMWETNKLNIKENNRMDSRFSQIEDISIKINESKSASCNSALGTIHILRKPSGAFFPSFYT